MERFAGHRRRNEDFRVCTTILRIPHFESFVAVLSSEMLTEL
jgi:hypothetical protein